MTTPALRAVPSARTVLQWIVLGTLVGLLCGAASSLFLLLLARATDTRAAHEWLVYALPLAGLAVGAVYERFGASVSGGSNLVIDTMHDDGPEIPLRLAPMVLLGTVLTHLFGGSAGREGTAVQMGASLTDWVSHRVRLQGAVRQQLLAAGVAGGFGSVFGTPVAGAIFGMEFIALGRLRYDALVPALIASVVGHLTSLALGTVHASYPVVAPAPLSLLLGAKWVVFAVAVAATAVVFIEATHRLKAVSQRLVPRLPLRLCIGGVLVVMLWRIVGTSDYLGLSLPLIQRAFADPALGTSVFALKLLFTVITLGAGFLGGEVTPLFVIGAALGNTMARLLHLPLDMAVAVGLAAVFAAAANTPLALSIMALELCGAALLPHVLIVCLLSYLLTGQRSIYTAQRVTSRKLGGRLPRPVAIRDLAVVTSTPDPEVR